MVNESERMVEASRKEPRWSRRKGENESGYSRMGKLYRTNRRDSGVEFEPKDTER